MSLEAPKALRADVALPRSFGAALLRGVRCRCPRCGDAPLFRKWLKPHDTCPACALDISGQRADDFPAYVSIFVTGHLLAPILIMLGSDFALSTFAILAITLPLAVVFMLATLQPAKGGVIALQWWHGMHGFRRERHPESDEDAA
ncbi:DUF983 domain-containing protein [Qipengyuania flava]|jgi:uncharacterized protein (DUF983 family)|uniref:DUF983 domain-containing protein n=1 Tax=Qipengyuania flava TaxID=192812 RepID=A0A222EXK2_9SPHN|nr:DUF983 domain-containing protein [Qipengyuania flava]KZX54738.1 hypothetical protein A3711_11930 [Erythrobacter sp. HI00D59]MEC7624336.1 DUF983 domain-containing protein [Pseudomonadota bacterium]OAN82014.1 hypothetical protein A8B77_12485 [Erythrobacter sp. EhN03]ASP31575.1 DUF983 domain-containing protein [Qipengyuania flava]MBO9504530.1 DUF983 domain-containing protein [Qipengyuania flava]|tara:strand:- start:144 stop:578 length:435 start_codon:yes stop_codon:yes gene_type:complete